VHGELLDATVLAAFAGTAAAIDIATRRIPNAVPLALTMVGVTLAATGVTGITPASSALGIAAGLLLMLPGHLFGATGAGDVKLFAAAGSVLGAGQMFEAFVAVAVAGGVLALAVAWRRGRIGRTVAGAVQCARGPREAKAEIESPLRDNRFAYGPAVAVGCIVAALI